MGSASSGDGCHICGDTDHWKRDHDKAMALKKKGLKIKNGRPPSKGKICKHKEYDKKKEGKSYLQAAQGRIAKAGGSRARFQDQEADSEEDASSSLFCDAGGSFSSIEALEDSGAPWSAAGESSLLELHDHVGKNLRLEPAPSSWPAWHRFGPEEDKAKPRKLIGASIASAPFYSAKAGFLRPIKARFGVAPGNSPIILGRNLLNHCAQDNPGKRLLLDQEGEKLEADAVMKPGCRMIPLCERPARSHFQENLEDQFLKKLEAAKKTHINTRSHASIQDMRKLMQRSGEWDPDLLNLFKR
eukprot:Plantae.Rhodophyta-Hildenbrandia_rubra.ctg11165.p1 GENE.Plantae.Rhodophyta-Hildenbrandia_rubra.ctg11165~~Plantae.Rhodophyta-Hildenbrandia_rubra.ctg11165.p1  ORF type:complete len:300 (+),score=61.94 Plantae.Rhodophyta-Hildenbrandia_rubra.ctg11165:653-1552(+)